MSNYYEIKNISDSILDVDTTSRRVKVALSKMGNIDLQNDVIDHGAYSKTLSERGPKAANLIWHLTDHNADFKSAIGKFQDLYTEGDFLIGVTDIPKTTWGNDMLEFYKAGHINQHSIGFKTIKAEEKNESTTYKLIKEVLLYEGSTVLWGANPVTPTLEVGKSLTKEEATGEIVKITNDLALLGKSFKDGRYTDSSFELIEIRIGQLTERIKNLTEYITLPEDISVEPIRDNEVDEAIEKSIYNILKAIR